MEYDTNKVDEATLALLYLSLGANGSNNRAWKSHDWAAMDRLHESGLMENPRSKNKSIILTEEGAEAAGRLFIRLFGKP